MLKVREILGPSLVTVSLKMYVDHAGEIYPSLCLMGTDENWQSISKICDSFQGEGISIMRGGPTKPGTIAISFALRKIPEKNGVL
jgi:hypothetical protein